MTDLSGRAPRGPSAVVVLGYLFLMVAWALSTPPFSAPDEGAHYLRALGLMQGELTGEPLGEPYGDPHLSEAQRAYVTHNTHWVTVPRGMAPDGYACNAFHPETSAGCATGLTAPQEQLRRQTIVAGYPPAFYLLPSLVLRAATNPAAGDWLGRFAGIATCLGLIALAIMIGRPFGVLLACTPMAVFLMSTLTASGPEIAAGVAFLSALLRLARDPPPRRAVWVAVTVSGAALALARPLGPIYVAMYLLFFALWAGRQRLVTVGKQFATQAGVAAALIGLSSLATVGWNLKYGTRFPRVDFVTSMRELPHSIRFLPNWAREQVGNFQYLDTAMPHWAYALFFITLAGAVVLAGVVSRGRDRVLLMLAGAAVVAFPVVLYVTLVRPTEFQLQGRYVLPLTVALPLVTCELLTRSRHLLYGTRLWGMLLSCVVIATGFVQVAGWWANARRSAVGTNGSWLFWQAAEWRPPLGWAPWLGLALLGVLLITAGALFEMREFSKRDTLPPDVSAL